MTDPLTFGHRRYNPLLDEWLIVSPHRIQRPWEGQTESNCQKPEDVIDISVKCTENPLSPGSVRASGVITPNYQSVYTFHNDFPALIWVCGFMPSLVLRLDKNQQNYALHHNGIPLLMDYAIQEEMNMINCPSDSRIIICSTYWLVIIPWWACWPFETMILPRKRHILWLHELTKDEKCDLSSVMKNLLVRYDNLFRTRFPYSMGWYQAPILHSEEESLEDLKNKYKHWQLHALYLPPLLRSSTVKKFMSGFELLAETQRDLLPETAAKMLRETSTIHYTEWT
ncbi:unnamed protein product [Schistosoma turkestanicum]|nr:unnamed protein product [Schistosoma turkestanicum]